MNLITFLIVAFISIVFFIITEFIFYILPAWGNSKREEAATTLAKNITYLDNKALPEARITSGQYLHDNFYKFLIRVLCNKPTLQLNKLKNIEYTQEDEQDRIKFRSEVERLDENTQKVINDAIYSASKVMFLFNPIFSFIFVLKLIKAKQNYHEPEQRSGFFRSAMMQLAEYLYIKKEKELIPTN